ncbi:CGNR zinc finger domain-containing protein [Streptomyces sp. NPDC006622]|uniref:CGNR zinc finger domain-containing protein n=1 Tax=Streptomyces sp. NPDC006622 TaxID=3155459 RepID=UPI0033B71A85
MPTSTPDPRPLTGEPLALDLLNTRWMREGALQDLLTDTDGLAVWLAANGLDERFAADAATLRHVLRAREALKAAVDGAPSDAGVDAGSVDAGVDGAPSDAGVDAGSVDAGVDGAPSDAGVDAGGVDATAMDRAAADPASTGEVDAVLEHGRIRPTLGPEGPGERAEFADETWGPAWLAARNYLELLNTAPDRIRGCAHEACVLHFFDTSRNGTRRWCSMAACGNRAKASRHYARTKDA